MIAVPAAATLEYLLYWVLRSFNFDDEHLCRFTYRVRMGRYVHVHDSDTGEFPTTDQVQIGTLPLEPGKTMELLYDFGDNRKFTITLNRIEPPGSSVRSPGILARPTEPVDDKTIRDVQDHIHISLFHFLFRFFI